MFADTLDTSWADRSRRGWTTLTSFGLEALVVGLFLLLPLLHPEGLPLLRRLATPISAGHLAVDTPPPAARQQTTAPLSNFASNRLMMPTRIPSVVAQISDEVPPPQAGTGGPYIPGHAGIGGDNGVLGAVPEGVRPVMQVLPPPSTHPIRVSQMNEGNLIQRVQPQYPAIARTARIQGQVVLQAVISKDGVIENLRVLSGQPMLVRAAVDAVSQWRYRPYLLNNESVEVETQITVNFSLTGN